MIADFWAIIQGLGHIVPKLTLLCVQEVSVLECSHPALLGSVSEWERWIIVQAMVFSRFNIKCLSNTDDIQMYISIYDFLKLQFDISNSWNFPPEFLAFPSNSTYLKLNPTGFLQIFSIYLPDFVNKYLHSCPYLAHELCVISDSYSSPQSTTKLQCLVHLFHRSCHLHSSGPVISQQHYCNGIQWISASALSLFQANALYTTVLISQGGTYHCILNSDVFNVSHCLSSKFLLLFLGIKDSPRLKSAIFTYFPVM